MHRYESFDIYECVNKIMALGELGLDWTANSQVIDDSQVIDEGSGSTVSRRIYLVISPAFDDVEQCEACDGIGFVPNLDLVSNVQGDNVQVKDVEGSSVSADEEVQGNDQGPVH